MESLARLLKEHPFLQALDEGEIDFLVGCAANRRYAPGTLLMHEGEPADVFFLLRAGQVALEIDVPGRGVVQLESLGPGDVLGWSWLFPPYRAQLDARAVDAVIALAFDGRCLREKMEQDEHLGFTLTKLLLHQIYQRLTRVRLQRVDVYRTDR